MSVPLIPSQPFDNNYTSYDPLMMNYMARGGMGYFPQPQFMTPASYGAYRTLPSQNFVTPQAYNPTVYQSFLTKNFGFGGVFESYNPSLDAQRRTVEAQRKLDDFGYATKGFAASIGAGAIGGAAGGPIGAVAGAVGTGLTYALVADRIRDAREVQRYSEARVVSGPMMHQMGQGFSTKSSANIANFMRQESIKNTTFNNDDYKDFFKIGLDNGLFDFTNNEEGFKKNIKKMVNNMEMFMSIYETADVDKLGKHMQRMQTMGVAMHDMTSYGVAEKTAARVMGMDPNDMFNTYGQQGAMIASSMGQTGYQGARLNMSNVAMFTLAQRAGLMDPGTLSRWGGVGGAAQNMTQKQMASNQNYQTYLTAYAFNPETGEIDKSKLQDVMSGKVDIAEMGPQIMANLKGNANTYGLFKRKFSSNLQTINDELGPYAQHHIMLGKVKMIMSQDKTLDFETAVLMAFDNDETAANQFLTLLDPATIQAMIKQEEVGRQKILANSKYKHSSQFVQRALVKGRQFFEDSFVGEHLRTRALNNLEERDAEENNLSVLNSNVLSGFKPMISDVASQADIASGMNANAYTTTTSLFTGKEQTVAGHQEEFDFIQKAGNMTREERIQAVAENLAVMDGKTKADAGEYRNDAIDEINRMQEEGFDVSGELKKIRSRGLIEKGADFLGLDRIAGLAGADDRKERMQNLVVAVGKDKEALKLVKAELYQMDKDDALKSNKRIKNLSSDMKEAFYDVMGGKSAADKVLGSEEATSSRMSQMAAVRRTYLDDEKGAKTYTSIDSLPEDIKVQLLEDLGGDPGLIGHVNAKMLNGVTLKDLFDILGDIDKDEFKTFKKQGYYDRLSRVSTKTSYVTRNSGTDFDKAKSALSKEVGNQLGRQMMYLGITAEDANILKSGTDAQKEEIYDRIKKTGRDDSTQALAMAKAYASGNITEATKIGSEVEASIKATVDSASVTSEGKAALNTIDKNITALNTLNTSVKDIYNLMVNKPISGHSPNQFSLLTINGG